MPNIQSPRDPQCGSTLIEVLVTIVILAFGLLGLVGLQAKTQLAEVESYQRAQAIVLLTDMVDRINANRSTAPAYAGGSVFGTGFTDPSPCPTAAGAARDQCEWSVALKGAAEKRSSSNVGVMNGGRGCITQLQAPDPTPATCTPGIYLVSVAWQGLNLTSTPGAGAACASGSYGDDRYRRVISARVVVGMPECS